MFIPSTLNSKNYYQILSIEQNASDQDIKIAYKKKALQYHPDKANLNNITVEIAENAFKQISEAYETLSDPIKRYAYDLKKGFISKPVQFKSNIFKEPFNFYKNDQEFNYKKAYEDNYKCYPEQIKQEVVDIIYKDDYSLLESYLKNHNSGDSYLESILYRACAIGKLNIVKNLIEINKIRANLKVNDDLSFTGSVFKATAESGNLLLVKYLYETHHADIESQGLSAGTRCTALSRAASKGHEEVVEYLLEKGANVNPEISNSNILCKAFSSYKVYIIILLVNAGTKIDNYDLGKALEMGNLDIIKFILQRNPGLKAHRYLESPACLAIKSGNVDLVKYLESSENLDLYKKFPHNNDMILSVLIAGAESGSIEMMKFLLEEKGLEKKVVDNENYFQVFLGSAIGEGWHCKKKSSDERLKFLKFLFEEKQFALHEDKLENIIKNNASFSSIEINCYLQSKLKKSEEAKDLLNTIACHGLNALSLPDLLRLFNSRLIRKGKYSDFSNQIHYHINNRNISLDQLREILSHNSELINEALFYYSSYYYKDNLSPLHLLVELGVDINAENSEGLAGIHVAINSGGCNKIFQFYVDQKADLTKKNSHGTTAEFFANFKK